MIYIDETGLELLICDCGNTEQTLTRICSSCGKKNEDMRISTVQNVLCANFYHNEPSGCENPKCWKYAGYKSRRKIMNQDESKSLSGQLKTLKYQIELLASEIKKVWFPPNTSSFR